MQVFCAVFSMVVTTVGTIIALSVQYPDIFKTGVNGIQLGLPFIIVPMAIVGVWWLVFQAMMPIFDAITRHVFSETRFPEFRSEAKPPEIAVAPAPATVLSKPASVSIPTFEARKPKLDEFDPRDVTIREVKINIGSYWEDKVGSNTLRITILGVDGIPGEQLVSVSFSNGGGMFYGGEKVPSPRVNQFAMPERNTGFQSEEMCVYNFSWSDTHIHFFVARANGIDLHNREVAINFANVQLMKAPKE
ncbi:hypothetical protein EI171_26850 [Bradyrhizobium sp. LCT2]|uniref:hypothetical protein n=1 Tax=Bradyrhizobium sp. LCT2 TaxID=2493093 RepID=UPI001374649D|nr:hypothetical protein [Bradyrhizobium sp. LCT2]QHP70582.1 hypothetical protein EI171_26850 [Bradyrhizobium sp. LCT2]